MQDINPTTRCYPRGMHDAFKFDYMSGIEHYKPVRNNNSVVYILTALGIICYLIGKSL